MNIAKNFKIEMLKKNGGIFQLFLCRFSYLVKKSVVKFKISPQKNTDWMEVPSHPLIGMNTTFDQKSVHEHTKINLITIRK